MKRIIILLFVIMNFCIIFTNNVNACSCAFQNPPKESLEEATMVFVGKVININTPKKIFISSADPLKITFDVSKIWKGNNYKNIVLETARDGVSCGYPFKENEEYIVYAYGKENELFANICNRTTLLADAQYDLQELGEGNTPTISDSSNISRSFNFILCGSVIGILIILVVIFVLITKKHKK